jgi:hypothetical protein
MTLPNPCSQPGWQPAPLGSIRRLCVALAMALVLTMALGPTSPCRAAGLVIQAPNLVATAGSSGSFDLLLVNTNPAGGTSYDVSADALGLSLSGPLSITFTDVTINTNPVTAPYIYVASATTVPGGLPLSLDSFPNTQFTASDFETASPFFRTVNPGDEFGRAHVSYTVSSTTPNGIDTIVIASGAATSLSDIDLNPIPFTIGNGSIRAGAAAIPEPSAFLQAATAAVIGLGAFWWRRKGPGIAAAVSPAGPPARSPRPTGG